MFCKASLIVVVFFFVYATRTEGIQYRNCGSSNSVFTVKDFNVSPDPPRIGSDVSLTADVDSSDTVTGGNVKITVKGEGPLSSLPEFSHDFDLCRVSPIGCPIPKGPRRLSFTRNIPNVVPAGTYEVKVEMTDNQGRNLFCASVDVTFTRQSALERLLRRLLLRY